MSSLLNVEHKGVQVPRIESFPLYASSAGQDAVDLAKVAGLSLDPWQKHVLEKSLGEKPGGKWEAFEVGLVVPRQNGKNIILQARELAGALLFGEKEIVHTAHEFKTCTDAFNKTWELVRGSSLVEYVAGYDGDPDARQIPGVKRAHGFESLRFSNGSTIKFMTRTASAGRGFTCDFLALDEAFALKEAQMAAIMPTLAARTLTHNPQIWYTSSAGMVSSEVLEAIRSRGISGDNNRFAYFEWSADEQADSEDRQAWFVANPGLGIHIDPEFVDSERKSMSDEQFRRERLGIWASEQDDPPVIDPVWWAKCLDTSSRPSSQLVFSLDIPPSRDCAYIAACSVRDDGVAHVEIVDQGELTGWVPSRLGELVAKFPGARVMVDGKTASGTFEDEFRRYRVPVTFISFRDYARACGLFFDAVRDGKVCHIGQTPLDEAVEAARVKPVGDSLWKWSKKNMASDIAPLVAVTLAFIGAKRFYRPNSGSLRKRISIL